MVFFNRLEPRQFKFKPHYYKPDNEKRIRFRRATIYDPHSRRRIPWVTMILLALVGFLIVILGGVKPSARPPTLSVDDAVENPLIKQPE